MGYYKGNSDYPFGYDKIFREFVDGKLMYTNKSGVTIITDLDHGISRHNIIFAREFADVMDQFRILIGIESTFVRILQAYSPGVRYGVVNNIYNIMRGQRGTRRMYAAAVKSFKTYVVKDPGLINVINSELDVTKDRLERNKKFFEEFASEAGMAEFTDYIRFKYNIGLYEYYHRLYEEFDEANPDYSGEDDQYVKITEFVRNKQEAEATLAGLKLSECVAKAIKQSHDSSLKKQQEYRALLKNERDDKWREIFNERVSNDVSHIMNAYYSNDAGVSEVIMKFIRDLIGSLEGKSTYYIACSKRYMVEYCGDEGIVKSIIHAKFYDSRDEAEKQANQIISEGLVRFAEVIELKGDPYDAMEGIIKEDWSKSEDKPGKSVRLKDNKDLVNRASGLRNKLSNERKARRDLVKEV